MFSKNYMEIFQMKKSLIAISLLTLGSTAALAGGPDILPAPPPPAFNGFYAGIGIGTDQANFRYDQLSTTSVITAVGPLVIVPGTDLSLATSARLYAGNVFGQFQLGFGGTFSDWMYAGVEGYIKGGSRLSSTLNTAVVGPVVPAVVGVAPAFTPTLAVSTRFRLNQWEPGINGRLGFLLEPRTMIFGLVGVGFNKVRTTTTVTGTGAVLLPAVGPIGPATTLVASSNRSQAAWRVGGGFERMVNDNWSLRADYTYSSYGNNRNRDAAFAFAGPLVAPFDLVTPTVGTALRRARAQVNTFMFSANYYFGNWLFA